MNFPHFRSDKINIKRTKVAKRVFLDYLCKKKLVEPTKRQHWRSVRMSIFYVEARKVSKVWDLDFVDIIKVDDLAVANNDFSYVVTVRIPYMD